MKAKEVHNLSDEEIRAEGDRLRRSLYDLKAQSVTEKLEDPSRLRKLRRDVARLMTERRSRQIAAQEKA